MREQRGREGGRDRETNKGRMRIVWRRKKRKEGREGGRKGRREGRRERKEGNAIIQVGDDWSKLVF